MKNKEKYFDELMEIIIDGYLLAVDKQTNRPEQCYDKIRCVDCLFHCAGCSCSSEEREKWLEQEYQEPITLTDDEKVILKNVPKNTKWIARDQNERLYLYCKEPQKRMAWWGSEWTKYEFSPYNHLFKFIKWEDENPYNIDELLKQNGVER